MKKKNNILSIMFSVILILFGLSFFIDISFNFTIFICLLLLIYSIFNVLSKEYLKGLYLFVIFLILLNTTSFLDIKFLQSISWSLSVIGVTLIYLGIKSLID